MQAAHAMTVSSSSGSTASRVMSLSATLPPGTSTRLNSLAAVVLSGNVQNAHSHRMASNDAASTGSRSESPCSNRTLADQAATQKLGVAFWRNLLVEGNSPHEAATRALGQLRTLEHDAHPLGPELSHSPSRWLYSRPWALAALTSCQTLPFRSFKLCIGPQEALL